jgi:hypothetical protein
MIANGLLEVWFMSSIDARTEPFPGSRCALGYMKPSAWPPLSDLYRNFQKGFTQRDTVLMYAHCDPEYEFTALDGTRSSLEQNRAAMEEALAGARSIRVDIEVQGKEWRGDSFCVRYRQVHEIQLPLEPKSSTRWFVAEDTWEQGDGQWKLVATRIVNAPAATWRDDPTCGVLILGANETSGSVAATACGGASRHHDRREEVRSQG